MWKKKYDLWEQKAELQEKVSENSEKLHFFIEVVKTGFHNFI